MPTNLLVKYNNLLEIDSLNPEQKNKSLLGVFDRDISNNNNFSFRNKKINPTTQDGKDKMQILFEHLTQTVVDKETKKREFDRDRSVRLHWIKCHIEENIKSNLRIFSVQESNGHKTYIHNPDEDYVVVLEPLREKEEYYILTAFYIKGKDKARDKYLKKYKRRLKGVL